MKISLTKPNYKTQFTSNEFRKKNLCTVYWPSLYYKIPQELLSGYCLMNNEVLAIITGLTYVSHDSTESI